jgi:hypothetical protein
VMNKIRQAIEVKRDSKGIIEILEKKSSELLNQFQVNQQSATEIIAMMARCDTQFLSLSKESRIISSVIPKIVKKLSAIETSVQEIKEHVSDLKTHADFASISDSLQLITSQLNSCDEIWSNIDTKLNALTAYIATQPTDLLRSNRAEISNELTAIEELFPDVQHLIQKTIEEANRCQLSKLRKRAEDCEYNLDIVQQRLEINTEEIQGIQEKFQVTQKELDAMSVLAREVSSHQQNATVVTENITKLCTDLRKKASMIRLKMIRDEEEKARVENELKEREEKIRQELLQQEEVSQRLQQEENLLNRNTALAELEREGGDIFCDPSSINDDGLELPPGWEWNHERQLYFNLLTREYQVDVPTLPAMSHQNTGIEEVMDHANLDEVTEYDFDGIRVYTFVDPEPETTAEGDAESKNRTSSVQVETIYDSEKKPSSSGEGKAQGGTKKIVKEVSYVFDGIRVYTTKEVDENEENEKEREQKKKAANDNEEMQRMEAIKQQQSISAELNQKISRVFKQGYLQKQGKYFGSWKKLYFVVSGNSIAHYPSKQSYQCGALPTKIIQLTGLSVLSYTRFNLCFTVHTGGRTYWTMMAEDQAEFQQWMEKLNTVIGALFDARIQACLDPQADDHPELF